MYEKYVCKEEENMMRLEVLDQIIDKQQQV